MSTIWIFKQYAVGPSEIGNSRHYEISRRIAECDHNVVIFAAGFHYARSESIREYGRLFEVESVAGVRFVRVPTIGYSDKKWHRVCDFLTYSCLAVFAALRIVLGNLGAAVSESPDHIVGCTVPPSGATAGLLVAFLTRASFHYEVGDLWPESLIDQEIISHSDLSAHLLRASRFLFCRYSATIITSLSNGKEFFESRKYCAHRQVRWIPNGAGSRLFSIRDTERQEGPFRILYTGAHSPIVGLETVIKAASVLEEMKIGDIEWILVGDGPEKSRLKETVEKEEISSVSFRDPVPSTRLSDIISIANAGVIPFRDLQTIRRYGLGSKTLSEYLAAGIPVILAARVAGNLVRESGGGITIPPEQPIEMARVALNISRLSSLELNKLGKSGRAYAREKLHWDVCAEDFLTLLTGSGGNHSAER